MREGTMFNRRLPFGVAAIGAFLLLASAAVAGPGDTFTATSTPSRVKASTADTYTIAITTSSQAVEANRATIAIPNGFAVAANSVRASASAAGACMAADWEPNVNSERIRLDRPGGGGNRQLCPGATLTVVFQATSPAREGSFTWNTALRGEDDEENVDFQPPNPHPTVVVDGTAPKALLTSGPPPLTNSRSASFTFSSDEPASFQCELDGGGFTPCASAAGYGGLGDGAHTFAVRPTDAVGNTGAASSHSWTIDATAPETTLGSAPRSGTTTASASFTFSASEPGSFECKLDAGAFAACTSPQSYTGLRRGTHSFEVRAIDAAGNVDPAAARHAWTIAAPRRAKVTSALHAPRAGARVTSPPLLAWRRAPRATYYNVQLFRGGVKVLSTWPVRTRLQLRSRWTYLGRQRRLTAGRYRWYVWPGYGRAAANRYGRLLGQSTFTVVAPGRR
jgi:hypothetical protein